MPKRKKPSQAKPSAIEERFTDLDKHPETAFSGSKAKLIKKHGHEEADWLKSQPAYTLFPLYTDCSRCYVKVCFCQAY